MQKTKEFLKVIIDIANQYEEVRPGGVTRTELLSFLDEALRAPNAIQAFPGMKAEIKVMTREQKADLLNYIDTELRIENVNTKEDILNSADLLLSGIRLVNGLSDKAA